MTREELLSKLALKRVAVEVEGLGTVYVREMTVAEIAKFRKLQESGSVDDVISFVILATLVDESGCTLLKPEDKAIVAGWGAGTITPIVAAANKLIAPEKKD